MKKRALLSTALFLAMFGMTANVGVLAEDAATTASPTTETASTDAADATTGAGAEAPSQAKAADATTETSEAVVAEPATAQEPIPTDSPQVQKLIALNPSLVARIAPFGRVCFEGEDCDISITVMTAAVDGQPRDGKTIYDGVCHTCHATGLVGAPKLGDNAAWASRLGKGKDTLYNSAINGLNAMPARGGADITDEEVRNAVDYIVGQSS